ncbi:MAG: OmpH family outer membrane protein [Armatimonadetes bacterium]|nr:OmpH family outer membrane protein [Armatimonadota bacterium]MDW8122817.1 OmpH family outer membrane protein [Armatimonadota bacterium]
MRLSPRLLCLVTLVVLPTASFIARSFSGPAVQPVAVGLVNIENLLKNYKAFVLDDERFRARVAQTKLSLAARRLLEKSEWDELDALEKKEGEGKLTPEENGRLEKLRKVTDERQAEMDRLRLKPSLSEEDKKRLAYLQNLQKENEPRLMEFQQQKELELAQIRESLTNFHRGKIREAAGQVAAQLGLKLILYDQEEVVLYSDSSLNVTDHVLAILNSEPKK